MKTTVSIHDFREAFRTMGRADQFTYQGLEVLFDFMEEMEQDAGEEYELDVIALCCDFAESTPEELVESYSIDLSDCDDEEDRMNACLDHLHGETMVCGHTDSTIIYQQF